MKKIAASMLLMGTVLAGCAGTNTQGTGLRTQPPVVSSYNGSSKAIKDKSTGRVIFVDPKMSDADLRAVLDLYRITP